MTGLLEERFLSSPMGVIGDKEYMKEPHKTVFLNIVLPSKIEAL